MLARNAYRSIVGVALAAAFLLVWVNLAVGIIGTEDYLANVMYVGVLAVGIIGAIIARFRPHGMARALFATALAQALVAVIATLIDADLREAELTGADLRGAKLEGAALEGAIMDDVLR
jgi:hypothetical protein